jgi:hypothetical protein
MEKMPTLFKRNDSREITREVNDGCQWIIDGEGLATRKWDGTCCLIKNGDFFKRRSIKKGKKTPNDFIEVEYDKNTGKTFGWVPVTKEDKWHVEGMSITLLNLSQETLDDGTYELIGPKIQGGVEGTNRHFLIKHKTDKYAFMIKDRSFDGIKKFFEGKDIEGIVFQHEDGRMVKIKKRDYGMKRGI